LRSSTLGQRLVATAGFETSTPGAKGSRKTAAMINREALSWLERRGDRPFFVFLNYYDAHAPFQPPDGFDLRFGLSAQPSPSGVTPPGLLPTASSEESSQGRPGHRQQGLRAPPRFL